MFDGKVVFLNVCLHQKFKCAMLMHSCSKLCFFALECIKRNVFMFFSCLLAFASNLTYFFPPSNIVVKKWNFKMNLMCPCYFFKYFVLRSGNFLHRCDTIVVFKKLFLFTHVSFGRSQHTTGKICCRTLLFLSFWRVLALFAQSLFKKSNCICAKVPYNCHLENIFFPLPCEQATGKSIWTPHLLCQCLFCKTWSTQPFLICFEGAQHI